MVVVFMCQLQLYYLLPGQKMAEVWQRGPQDVLSKGAFRLSELASQSGGSECEMDVFHKIFPEIHHNNV